MSEEKLVAAPDTVPKGEVRVSNRTYLGAYLGYIAKQFEAGQDPIVLKATGLAIGKTNALAALCMHRFKGLHQLTVSSEAQLPAPKRGKNKAEEASGEKRRVELVTITLSKKELDKTQKGYVPPVPEAEVQEYVPREKVEKVERGTGRGRFSRMRRYGGFRYGFSRRGRGRGRRQVTSHRS